MKKKIDLSIIVPVYNVEIYLKECLESIYSIKDIDYEVILVNDGSTDNSLEILEKYTKKYQEITKLINKKNGGQSSARNLGIEVAIGEYISFIDSDDFIDSKNFSNLIKKVQNNNLDIGIGNLYRVQNSKEIKYKRNIYSQKEFTGLRFVDECLKKSCHRTEAWINLYKREFILRNRLNFEEGVIYEDALFIMKAFYYAEKVMYFDIPFYYYRFNPESTVNKKVNNKNYISAYKILNKLIIFYKENDIKIKSWEAFLIRRYFFYLKNWNVKNDYLYTIILGLKSLTFKDYIRKIYIFLFNRKAKLIDLKEEI